MAWHDIKKLTVSNKKWNDNGMTFHDMTWRNKLVIIINEMIMTWHEMRKWNDYNMRRHEEMNWW